MEAVILLDQRLSRRDRDRVDDWATHLNDVYGRRLTRPFVRTAGDEMQALTKDAEAFVQIVMAVAQDGGWWAGIGIGEVERPLGVTARESRGPAFWLARDALAKAKNQRTMRSFVLFGEPAESVTNLSACMHALGFVLLRRTRRQCATADLFRGGLSVGLIAERQGVTQQAVRGLLQAAGAQEERELRALAASLASQVLA